MALGQRELRRFFAALGISAEIVAVVVGLVAAAAAAAAVHSHCSSAVPRRSCLPGGLAFVISKKKRKKSFKVREFSL